MDIFLNSKFMKNRPRKRRLNIFQHSKFMKTRPRYRRMVFFFENIAPPAHPYNAENAEEKRCSIRDDFRGPNFARPKYAVLHGAKNEK